MSQTIDRDEGVGFLSSLGVLCLAADGRWAVKRPGTNGLDGPFKARGRPGFASHWPPWPRPVVLCAGRSAPAWLAFAGSARRQTAAEEIKNSSQLRPLQALRRRFVVGSEERRQSTAAHRNMTGMQPAVSELHYHRAKPTG